MAKMLEASSSGKGGLQPVGRDIPQKAKRRNRVRLAGRIWTDKGREIAQLERGISVAEEVCEMEPDDAHKGRAKLGRSFYFCVSRIVTRVWQSLEEIVAAS
jgi:hypothetical protein